MLCNHSSLTCQK